MLAIYLTGSLEEVLKEGGTKTLSVKQKLAIYKLVHLRDSKHT